MTNQSSSPSAQQAFLPPTWFEELSSSLAIRSHFVMSGNTRDLYPVMGANGIVFVAFETAVWLILKKRGYAALLRHDPFGGLRLHQDCDPRYEERLKEFGIPLGTVARDPETLQEIAATVVAEARMPIALMVDYASAMMRHPVAPIDRLFVAMDRIARAPAPQRPASARPMPRRNPVFWMVENAGDLPDWFATENVALRSMAIGMPDLQDRVAFVASLIGHLHDHDDMHVGERQLRTEQLAVRTEGMSLVDLRSIVQLARAENFGLRGIEQAMRSYQIGTTRNPWTSAIMRHRIRYAREVLEKRVKGQPRAIEKTYDILVRSIMGLTGAQTSSRGNRPRGVLFFVGPTGTGKTELAKAITEVMFGDENAMVRFDMSEFMGAEGINRLIGAPVGSAGYESGGELVNAVRTKPFSVFLFDEIEKGHPRILDAFLQILDDGRLTDTRGETGFFSESLIIFTSNIGMVGGDRTANSGQNVLPSDSPEVLEQKLQKAVSDHFKYELKRPELFNRMGQNIVPFEFIRPQSGTIIFTAIMKKVFKAIHEEHGVKVSLTPEANEALLEICTMELNDGGRGIGNRIETNFINPIARALFEREGTDEVVVSAIDTSGKDTKLVLLGDAPRPTLSVAKKDAEETA
ncbi:MAG: AAA family ATPase [Pseudomonadota bacterium]